MLRTGLIESASAPDARQSGLVPVCDMYVSAVWSSHWAKTLLHLLTNSSIQVEICKLAPPQDLACILDAELCM